MTNTVYDWPRIIAAHTDALLRVVEIMVRLVGAVAVPSLRRSVHGQALRVLRPAEAALRRVIILAMHEMTLRGIAAKVPAARAAPAPAGPISKGEGVDRVPAFALIDPRKRFLIGRPVRYARYAPRISIIGVDAWEPIPIIPDPTPDDPINAKRLFARLESLKQALDDVPKQALRMMRIEARRAAGVSKRKAPMRPGQPPGYRAKVLHPVDGILNDCHGLALRALHSPDTG